MPQILYSVRVTCPNAHVLGRFLAWLSPNHILGVKAGGAIAARVILPEQTDANGPAVAETQYEFPSRKALDDYFRLHAPALRADAQKHFPPDSGVIFERQIAEIAIEL